MLLLGWGELEVLWISLALALSWSAYGLVRKVTPVGSLPGLTVEMLVLVPAPVAWPHGTPPVRKGSALARSLAQPADRLRRDPDRCSAAAVRGCRAADGFFRCWACCSSSRPTLVFVLGVTVFGEPLRPVAHCRFAIIWMAIALFVGDLLARARGEGLVRPIAS